jgi:hypothetical protein
MAGSMRLHEHRLTIADLEFYRAEESAIRIAMKQFETGLFPVADQAVKDAGFRIARYPKEGYYHDELGDFFDRIRTLQNNFTETITPAIKKLHEIYTTSIFGIKQARPSALNPDDVYYKGDTLHPSAPVTISTMIDPITVASDKTGPTWTIEKIMNAVDRNDLGTCLVGLGIIVDQIDRETRGKYMPFATCMACETTVLTREVCTIMGRADSGIEWKVSPEVEEYGKKVIDGYRSLFEKHSKVALKLPYVTSENVKKLLDHADSMERCANLNIDYLTRRSDPYYHWAIRFSDNGVWEVIDFFANRIVTTVEWHNNKNAYI